MRDDDFHDLKSFKVHNGLLQPVGDHALEYVAQCSGQTVYLKPMTPRDIKFHAVYFLFCSWLWEQMPKSFQEHRCPKKSDMYKYLKIVEGRGKQTMKFKDIVYLDLPSVAFGKMNDEKFKSYVNEQIICFYENCLVPLKLESLLDEANEEFERLFNDLV